jgi:hypothetical protein
MLVKSNKTSFYEAKVMHEYMANTGKIFGLENGKKPHQIIIHNYCLIFSLLLNLCFQGFSSLFCR